MADKNVRLTDASGNRLLPQTALALVDGAAAALAAKLANPSGGTTGQVLKKTADGTAWGDESGGGDLPTGGTTGQVLTMTASGAAWADAPTASAAITYEVVE